MKFPIHFRQVSNPAKFIIAIAILGCISNSCQLSNSENKNKTSVVIPKTQLPNIYVITTSNNTYNCDFISTSPVITDYNSTQKTTTDFNNFLKKSQQCEELPVDLTERSLCFKQLADLILKYPNEAFTNLKNNNLYDVNLESPDQKVKIRQIVTCWDFHCDPSMSNAFTQLLSSKDAFGNKEAKLLTYSTDILHILFNDFYMERCANGIFSEKDKDGNTFYLVTYTEYFSKGHDFISNKVVAFTISDKGIQKYAAFRINGKESCTLAYDYSISSDDDLTSISYDAANKMLIIPEIDNKSELPTGRKLQYKFDGSCFKIIQMEEKK